MARIQVLVDDLMLQSKVAETLRACGHEPRVGGEPGADVELIVADIDAIDLSAVAAAAPPKLGFHPHTEPEKREAAEAAGFDRVVPRSRMARELPDLVAALLAEAPDATR